MNQCLLRPVFSPNKPIAVHSSAPTQFSSLKKTPCKVRSALPIPTCANQQHCSSPSDKFVQPPAVVIASFQTYSPSNPNSLDSWSLITRNFEKKETRWNTHLPSRKMSTLHSSTAASQSATCCLPRREALALKEKFLFLRGKQQLQFVTQAGMPTQGWVAIHYGKRSLARHINQVAVAS